MLISALFLSYFPFLEESGDKIADLNGNSTEETCNVVDCESENDERYGDAKTNANYQFSNTRNEEEKTYTSTWRDNGMARIVGRCLDRVEIR